ncbi:MAG TPA: PmoA family protein [Verrucomicrobiota bacterium]|nr:PmoA family protein [Verrucomicrobiota bacterium]HNU51528.1 PmoA family protein [Verrucomicrobiota bacterium]
MRTPRRFWGQPLLAAVVGAIALFAGVRAGSPLAAEVTAESDWIVRWNGKPVCVYAFAQGQIKPYVRELTTLAGYNVLRDSPSDHKHHHALMYGIRVNGVNFWEEAAGAGVQKPVKILTRKTGRSSDGKPQAVFGQRILWLTAEDASTATSEAQALLAEDRTLTVIVDEADRAVAVHWHAQFTVGGKTNEVALTGANYHGLGVRFLAELDAPARHIIGGRALDLAGTQQDCSAAAWGAVSFDVPGRPATLAITGGPANAGGPPVFFSMHQPFAYLSATQALDRQTLTRRRGERWTLDYRVVVYPDVRSASELARSAEAWIAGQRAERD